MDERTLLLQQTVPVQSVNEQNSIKVSRFQCIFYDAFYGQLKNFNDSTFPVNVHQKQFSLNKTVTESLHNICLTFYGLMSFFAIHFFAPNDFDKIIENMQRYTVQKQTYDCRIFQKVVSVVSANHRRSQLQTLNSQVCIASSLDIRQHNVD